MKSTNVCAQKLHDSLKNAMGNPLIMTFSDSHQNGTVAEGIFSRFLTEDAKRLEYFPSPETRHMKTQLHWGQLKLLLSEIEFLTLALKQHQASGTNKTITVVYAGAAPGNHILVLAELFPQMNFVLYDPQSFDKLLFSHPRIEIHTGKDEGFFTEIDAEYWNGQNSWNEDEYIVFVTDIRNPSVESSSDVEVEAFIKEDMDRQLAWWLLMQPELSSFKFRLPWGEGRTRYVNGIQYLQAYPCLMSTETRLVVEKGASLIDYDNKTYEQQCFHHNYVVRAAEHSDVCGVGAYLHQCRGLDMCYDCTSFVFIVKTYLETVGMATTSDAIMQMVNRLVSKAGSRMDLVDAYAIHQSQMLESWRKKRGIRRVFADTGAARRSKVCSGNTVD
jgi:hypothetical protein